MCWWAWRRRSCARRISGWGRESTTTMTWRSAILSSAMLALWPGAALAAGNVSGELELTNSKDPAVRKHKDYSGVVIWLEPVDRPAPPSPNRHVEMLQKDKRFLPHVVA